MGSRQLELAWPSLPNFYPALVAKIQARLRPDPDSPKGCVVWTGAGGRIGLHGRIKFGGKLYAPHRVMLEWKLQRELPRHIDACHRCDNPPCCFEAHLWAGTRSDNSADAVSKGRLRPPAQTPERIAKRVAAIRRRMTPWILLPLHSNASGRDHRCRLCDEPIRPGDFYFDRGKKQRAHADCAMDPARVADATCSLAYPDRPRPL